jgi:hypothetical protein
MELHSTSSNSVVEADSMSEFRRTHLRNSLETATIDVLGAALGASSTGEQGATSPVADHAITPLSEGSETMLKHRKRIGTSSRLGRAAIGTTKPRISLAQQLSEDDYLKTVEANLNSGVVMTPALESAVRLHHEIMSQAAETSTENVSKIA